MWKWQGYIEVPSENVHSDTILKAPPVTNPLNRQDPDNILTERHGKVGAAVFVLVL